MQPLTKSENRAAEIEHERLTSLINSMADGVIAVDENINVVLYNAAALNILDLNESIADKPLAEILKPVNLSGHAVNISAAVKRTKLPTTNRDLKLTYSDGSSINLYLSIAPVRLGYGARGQRGFVLLLRDITREKSLEEERDEFISVVSHELRTPIAIAEGNISNAQFIAEKSGDVVAIKKSLTQAHDQALFLAQLVNDLSTLARAERGKLTLEAEVIDVPKLVNEVAESYQKEAAEKNLKLTTKVDGKVNVVVSGTLYVHEILQNFITNALKYTKEGSVTIGALAAENGVNLFVSDTGIGISKTDQKKVFDKFFRSEDFRTRESSGTGLGLYVTTKLAHLIDAKISLKSELNHGSTFSIFVPNLDLRKVNSG